MSSLVLITGCSGFVGAEIALEALRQGYSIRLVFRQQVQAAAWSKAYPSGSNRTESVIVPDFAAEGALDEAMRGVAFVAHAASPVIFDFEDNERDCLAPAKDGVLAVLKAAAKSETVKRVVVTSSIVAFFNVLAPPPKEHVITEKDWANLDYDQVLGWPRKMGQLTYFASKYIAEKAAWEFMSSSSPSFSLTTIAPTFVLGHNHAPSLTLSNASGSYGHTAHLLSATSIQLHPIGSFVNVLTVAQAHILSFTAPLAPGRRYLLVAGPFNDEMVVEIARRAVPDQAGRWPELPEGGARKEEMRMRFDDRKVVEELGVEYIDLEETVQSYAKQLLSLPA